MNKIIANKFSNFLLALLISIFFIVLTFRIVEYYNLKYVIFEKENVVKVKLEIVSDFDNEILILEKPENIEKILKIRNELRRYEDPKCECIPVNLHFTIYTLEGREIYEGFKNIKLNNILDDIYETQEIKKRTIPLFSIDENDIMSIKIVNSITGEEMIIDDLLEDLKIEEDNANKINNLNSKKTNEVQIDYSKTEVVDSIINSMKNYYLKRKYINEDDVSSFDVYITLKNEEIVKANIYNKDENTIDIIRIINKKLLTNINDLEYVKITFKNKDVFVNDEETLQNIFKKYVNFTNKDSIMGIEYKLINNQDDRAYFGSILLGDVTEDLYEMFE